MSDSKRNLFVCYDREIIVLKLNFNLASESVKGLSLTLEGIDNVHGSDGLAAGVLGVSDGITNDVLKEDLEDSTGFFVNESRDTLDTTTTSETADSGLGNSLDIIAKDLSVTLGASLAQSFSSFSTSLLK